MTPEQEIELASLRTRRALYVNAEVAILDGAQSYTVGIRSLTRADLSFIASMISILGTQITDIVGEAGIFVQGVIPLDI